MTTKRCGLRPGKLFWTRNSCFFAAAIFLQLESTTHLGSYQRYGFSMLLANALTTQMARYLLPAYPHLRLRSPFSERPWLPVNRGGAYRSFRMYGYTCRVWSILASSLPTLSTQRIFCPCRWAWKARRHFSGPDGARLSSFQVCKFRASPTKGQSSHTLFLRHTYYLRVPYENGGSSRLSWMMNPDVLSTSPQTLLCISERAGYPVGS